MDIAKIIREGREKLNLNQSQLAELVGVSPQAVQQWESGATQPRGKRLNKIAQVLKLPPTLMHFGAASETLDAQGAIAGSAPAGGKMLLPRLGLELRVRCPMTMTRLSAR